LIIQGRSHPWLNSD